MNEKVADYFVCDRRHDFRPKCQVVFDFDQDPGWHFLKCPHYVHSLCERLQVVKANFNTVAIDDLFGSPGNRNAGARSSHYDNVPAGTMFEVTDIAIVRENLWP